ncbi:MogA/MoaB family molybdenum cofactor biosynthesis protein [Ktedonospora formicarum]|uniref:Molybdenum cofactor biosynthesis protein n=1 Tax=Ktedonospora formicarum TaxID=2778364 RepID=A0A8J3MSA6_9CHLR|nr:MogA/MoaB family molybdenum cofactor biosynthesis protein [Ktedonospora formicarum]GHO44413.1 molybdenum cofactor biosynthesis protein [Ktedonospora formicarum]
MITIGVLTISDGAARGQREDLSGERVRSLASQLPEAVISTSAIIPDEQEQIAAILREWCDIRHLNLILTTGGTGLAPRDVTPEATRSVIEREAPGIAEAMRFQSLQFTKMAMLSRGVVGVRGRSLIVNLPGSPKAVKECLEYILEVLPHAMNLLTEGPREH